MKNVFCIAILCIGFLSISQAQVLEYYVHNSSTTDTWNWALDDAGPSAAQYELNILPGETRSGFIGLFSFPVEWKANDSNNCYGTTVNAGPVPTSTLPTTCFGTNITYKIVEVVPFVYYVYKANLP
ncbi:MAG: hypothetical protein P1U56_23280 [Saprospiraceae bacterium]|nr:hypothetical protein [Saprospiraceae bacterium]